MKNKILLSVLLTLSMISLSACSNKENLSDALKFKQEYESFNGKKNDYFEYRNISIKEDNPFIYATPEEIVEKVENKESFIVYFGDPECPWCRSVIEESIASANKNEVEKIYYVRIWDGFHNEILRDTYELKDGTAVLKKKGTESYEKIIKYFDNVLEDYILQDENTKIEVGEKRIFAPNFIKVKDGIATDLIEGTSKLQENYNSDLTNEIILEEQKIFDNFFKSSK